MKFFKNPKRELEKEMMLVVEQASEYPVGSDEYLNACRASNQLAEAAQKCKRVDLNQFIPGVASVTMFIIYMVFNEEHITDTRGIQFVKGLFRKNF
jgi:hypothetical protein